MCLILVLKKNARSYDMFGLIPNVTKLGFMLIVIQMKVKILSFMNAVGKQ